MCSDVCLYRSGSSTRFTLYINVTADLHVAKYLSYRVDYRSMFILVVNSPLLDVIVFVKDTTPSISDRIMNIHLAFISNCSFIWKSKNRIKL